MTDEHIPPRSTGNDQPVQAVENPFDLQTVLREVAEWDQGHVVRTLDAHCNRRASDWGYVKEYRKWHDLLKEAHVAGRATRFDPFRGDQPFPFELPYDAMPARFVRQVVGMLLAVQQSYELMAGFPQLAELIDSEPDDGSRSRESGVALGPFHLYLSVHSGSWAYDTSPVTSVALDLTTSSLVVPTSSRMRMSDVYVLVLTPFVFVGAGQPEPDLGMDVSHWASMDESARLGRQARSLTLPTVDMMQPALRAMLRPGDYVIGQT